jgi:hypothetical protein
MIVIAATCPTLLHPGLAFKGVWSAANFTFRTRKNGDVEKPLLLRRRSLRFATLPLRATRGKNEERDADASLYSLCLTWRIDI